MANYEINQELSKYADCIKRTIALAQIRYDEEDASISKQQELNRDIDDLQLGEELYRYLCTLVFENLAVIQTLMNIGRDGTYIEKDGTYNYHYVRKDMDDLGWPDEKSVTAFYLFEKNQLAKNLMDGCKKIGFTL